MPKAVRKLKKYNHGYPVGLKSNKQWKNILEKIARGFEATEKLNNLEWLDEYDSKYGKDRKKKLEKEIDEGFSLFKDYFRNLWD